MSFFVGKKYGYITVTEECIGEYTEIDTLFGFGEYRPEVDDLFDLEELDEEFELEELDEPSDEINGPIEDLDAASGPAGSLAILDNHLCFEDKGNLITFSNEEGDGVSLVKSLASTEWGLNPYCAMGDRAFYCAQFDNYTIGEHWWSMGWREHPDEEISMKKSLHQIIREFGLHTQTLVLYMKESGLETTQIKKVFDKNEDDDIYEIVEYHKMGLIKTLTPTKRELKKAFIKSQYEYEDTQKEFKEELCIKEFFENGYELKVAKNPEDLINRSVDQNICVGHADQPYVDKCERGFTKILFLDNKKLNRKITIELDCVQKKFVQVSGFANSIEFSEEEEKIIKKLENRIKSDLEELE